MKKAYVYSLIPFILSLVLVLFSAAKFPGHAQTPTPQDNSPSAVTNINFIPPDREGPSVIGGFTVGYKGKLCDRLVVLIPTKTDKLIRFGVTVSEHPKIFTHVLESDKNPGMEVDLYLDQYDPQTERRTEIYTAPVQLPDTPGIIQVNLPSEISLELGQFYELSFYASCYLGDFGDFEVHDIWIERIEVTPQLTQQLASASTAIERANIYAEAGIWIDAIDALAQARRQVDTPELQAAWRDLLEDEDAFFYSDRLKEKIGTPAPILN